MVVLAGESLKNVPGAVGRDVVDGVDPVAELRYVANRLLDEDVLVADEDDAHDPGAHLAFRIASRAATRDGRGPSPASSRNGASARPRPSASPLRARALRPRDSAR